MSHQRMGGCMVETWRFESRDLSHWISTAAFAKALYSALVLVRAIVGCWNQVFAKIDTVSTNWSFIILIWCPVYIIKGLKLKKMISWIKRACEILSFKYCKILLTTSQWGSFDSFIYLLILWIANASSGLLKERYWSPPTILWYRCGSWKGAPSDLFNIWDVDIGLTEGLDLSILLWRRRSSM